MIKVYRNGEFLIIREDLMKKDDIFFDFVKETSKINPIIKDNKENELSIEEIKIMLKNANISFSHLAKYESLLQKCKDNNLLTK